MRDITVLITEIGALGHPVLSKA